MEDVEEWRPIPSLPQYEASSFGRIRRATWVGRMPNGASRTYGGKAWFGAWDKERGRFVFMYRGKTYRVAPMVCEAFHGSAPVDRPNCLHGDENSRNNRPSNLSWGTQKENLNATGFLERCASRPQNKLTPARCLAMSAARWSA